MTSPQLRKRDVVLLLMGAGSCGVLWLLAWVLVPGVASGIAVIVAAGFLGALSMETYRRLQDRLRKVEEAGWQHYAQIDALLSLHAFLRVQHPLPPMRGWAITPDFARLMVEIIHEMRPGIIVEIGSGVSTIVAGYCLKQIGTGRIVSLEHESGFAETTRKHLAHHGLEGIATVVHAPLVERSFGNEVWRWYTTSDLLIGGPIDLLIVDGPPGRLGPMIRYPALPAFEPLLSDKVVVLLDDTTRVDERRILDRWLRQFPAFHCEYVETEEGAAVLRRDGKCGPTTGDALLSDKELVRGCAGSRT